MMLEGSNPCFFQLRVEQDAGKCFFYIVHSSYERNMGQKPLHLLLPQKFLRFGDGYYDCKRIDRRRDKSMVFIEAFCGF